MVAGGTPTVVDELVAAFNGGEEERERGARRDGLGDGDVLCEDSVPPGGAAGASVTHRCLCAEIGGGDDRVEARVGDLAHGPGSEAALGENVSESVGSS